MLNCHGHAGADDDGCIWFDLVDPDDAELKRVADDVGVRLPDRASLGSVELSSRAVLVDDTLRLSIPWFTSGHSDPSPLGLVLTPRHLVSLRYAAAAEFDAAASRFEAESGGSPAAFTTLVATIVGNVADRLEMLTAEVDRLSSRLFRERNHGTRRLRSLLGLVGRTESRLARARVTASGLLRIVMFAHDEGPDWLDEACLARLESARKDLGILTEIDAQLTDKLQFLLDAALGFISVEQNDVMKIFTVASVAAIPPVILAGIWGMNFRHMPELGGLYSYPAALAVMALSILLPVLWFRHRGWF